MKVYRCSEQKCRNVATVGVAARTWHAVQDILKEKEEDGVTNKLGKLRPVCPACGKKKYNFPPRG